MVPEWQFPSPSQAAGALQRFQLESPQGVPIGAAGLEHSPEEGSQVPGTWHESRAEQALGTPPHSPSMQLSLTVQVCPSSQDSLFDFSGYEQFPVPGAQMPSLWHWSGAAQVTGSEPVQTPARHWSVWVQASLSSQAT